MIAPRDVLRRVRRVELRTRKLVRTALQGQYLSSFRGQGIEFDDVREYIPGDDVRAIDWNVTARFDRPYVRTYVEERELRVLLCVDVSGSFRFGTGRSLKSDLALDLAAGIAFSAGQSHDRVGLVLYTNRVERYIPPRKGRRHVMRIIREILFHVPQGSGTDLDPVIRFCGRLFKKQAAVFLISDFLGPVPDPRLLGHAARRHDLMTVVVSDPAETRLPRAGLVRLQDQETGRILLVNSSDPVLRRTMEARASARHERLRSLFTRCRVDPLYVSTDEDPVRALIDFFKLRKKGPR